MLPIVEWRMDLPSLSVYFNVTFFSLIGNRSKAASFIWCHTGRTQSIGKVTLFKISVEPVKYYSQVTG